MYRTLLLCHSLHVLPLCVDDDSLFRRRMLILNSSGASPTSTVAVPAAGGHQDDHGHAAHDTASPSLLIPNQSDEKLTQVAMKALTELRASNPRDSTAFRKVVFLGTNSQMPRPGTHFTISACV